MNVIQPRRRDGGTLIIAIFLLVTGLLGLSGRAGHPPLQHLLRFQLSVNLAALVILAVNVRVEVDASYCH